MFPQRLVSEPFRLVCHRPCPVTTCTVMPVVDSTCYGEFPPIVYPIRKPTGETIVVKLRMFSGDTEDIPVNCFYCSHYGTGLIPLTAPLARLSASLPAFSLTPVSLVSYSTAPQSMMTTVFTVSPVPSTVDFTSAQREPSDRKNLSCEWAHPKVSPATHKSIANAFNYLALSLPRVLVPRAKFN